METPMKRFMPRTRKFATALLATVAATVLLATVTSAPAQARVPDETIQEACGPDYLYLGGTNVPVTSSTGSVYGNAVVAIGLGWDFCVLVEKSRDHSGWGVSTHMETVYKVPGEPMSTHGGDRVQYTMQHFSLFAEECVQFGVRIEHPTPGNWGTATGEYCHNI